MLTIKEISEKFNISKSTLYGWEKERSEIFDYLQRADEKYEDLRDITIILDKFAQNIDGEFTLEELEFIIALDLKISDISHIENLQDFYSSFIIKDIKEKSAFVMPIYGKLERLNLVEKYIFAKRYKELVPKLAKTKEDKQGLIKHYFKPFLVF
ncbi:MAG: helix-turn-helix domain-containing protein [Arcobacteraceae bacterium]|jgi:transcriptional regulator with XRE-family HTH domain|nr:helix-turn-helix domain-containing protein [Arcobacteraceae bacterium]